MRAHLAFVLPLFCSCLQVHQPVSAALVAEADADTDADPICSSEGSDVTWLTAPGVEVTTARVRADWRCDLYTGALAEACVALKAEGVPVVGTGEHFYLSGASDRWPEGVVADLRGLPREAFVVHVPAGP